MSKTSTPTRAAIYARISDDREGKAAGVERQKKECQELAERLGWDVVNVYIDNSISAYSGAHRPEYQKMLQGLRERHYEAVIAWGVDRLTRHPRELEDLVDVLTETGTRVETVTSGTYDLTNADGRAHARIAGTIARQSSEKSSERIKAQKREATAAGRLTGGRRAFGWTDSRKAFVEEEISMVREMATRVLSGESVSGITNHLNDWHWTTSQGRPWTRATVRQLLTNPATAGLRKQPDGGVVEGDWEGAYDRDTWNRLCAILNDPSRKTTHRLRSYLLTGLVYDPSARKMVTGHDKRGRIYRTDTTMGKTTRGASIGADLVEANVIEAVLKLSDRLVLKEPEKESPFALVDGLNAELDALAGMYGKGEITASQWNEARLPLQARLNEARKSVKVPTSTMDWATPGQLRAEWDTLSLAQRRSAIEEFVERVVILPAHGEGRKQAADRVSIKWKS